ncbi:MAG: phosphoenolpyruvate-utilizing protein [Dehalococcoidia bacterium]|nr:phosphoenolpyruvate-utilizing protein [Dehalococcoidia bacterium]
MPGIRWIEDQPFIAKVPFMTRANVGEVIPEPPSPLGWDLVFANGGTIRGWRDCATVRLGIGEEELDPDPNRHEWIGLQGGYGYLNAAWIRIWGERTPGMSAAAIDAAYFGDHPDVPPYVAEPWHQNPATTEKMTEWLGWVMGTMEQDELNESREESRRVRASRPNLATATDRELLDRAISMRPLCRKMFDIHINQSGAAAIGPGTITAVCAAIGKPEAAMRLIVGLGGVDSAAPSYAMWELSRKVRASAALMAMFDAGPAGLNARLRASDAPDAQAFVSAFDEFLAEFGSRGPNEWDLIAATWETTPDIALAAIDRMRLAADSESPRGHTESREAERKAVEAEVLEALAGDPETQATFRAAMASSATYVPGRERAKTTIVRVIEESRVAVWEIGRRAMERGEIDHPSEICYLFQDELSDYIDGKLTGVKELVAARKAHREWLQTLEPPFIINGPPPPNTTWPKRSDRTVAPVSAGEVLAGVSGCPGTARGRARVVLDPSDPTVLEPGDILVAPMTDPAWTPLFVPAAGVVVDVGAALSHAIIVSRELGIPCAVSVTGASQRIPDGALVEVNGDQGTVTVLELP